MENKQTTFLERLQTEASELLEKTSKLRAFLESPSCEEKVGSYQYKLLLVQENSMSSYLGVLALRLDDLENGK